MKRTRAEFLEDVKAMIGEILDWNLRDAEVVKWRVKYGRLQVVLIDRCPLGAEDTRDYVEKLADLANKQKIDLTILHKPPTTGPPSREDDL